MSYNLLYAFEIVTFIALVIYMEWKHGKELEGLHDRTTQDTEIQADTEEQDLR